MVSRLLAEGHEIGNHLTRDERSIGLGIEAFESEMLAAHAALSPFQRLRWIRPGGGRYDADMAEIWASHGYRCALGSVYPFDAHVPWVCFARRFVLSHVRNGSIIVLHDRAGRGARTVDVLSKVLPALHERRVCPTARRLG